MKSKLFIAVITFLCISFSGLAQKCDGTLSAQKGRSSKSTFSNGAFFTLELTNNSDTEKTYNLTTESLDTQCDQKRMAKFGRNVKVDAIILDASTKSPFSGTITVAPKKTYVFKVKATPFEGTEFKKWSCVRVTATTTDCPNSSLETVLKVFIADPTER